MATKIDYIGELWRLPMRPRNPDEAHRQSSFLELFFDLCFVVAIAQAAAQLHHALAEDHILSGIINFAMVFFAIWWAWMNFTWFASAYDNDDVPFRIATFVQITGALILAAGVQRGFADQNYTIIVLGYIVMRIGLVTLWIRAAFSDPERRATNARYAIGIVVAQVGWVAMLLSGYWPFWCFVAMVIFELLVPVWAESKKETPWHPGHIAERYGLLTIIVLGESVLAATNAVQVALNQQGAGFDALLAVIGGGLLILFSMWWLYFSKSAAKFLSSIRVPLTWGYGHYFVFVSAAAVGAGLAVNVDHIVGHTAIGDLGAAASITIPVAIYLCMLWFLHIRHYKLKWMYKLLFPAAAVAVLLSTFSSWPILTTGLITVTMVGLGVFRAHHDRKAS